jgi:hypothetical protein
MIQLISEIVIKVAALCFCVLPARMVQAQSPAQEVRFWKKDQSLSFEDFKGRPVQKDTAGSGTYSQEALTHRLGTIVTALDVLVRTDKGKTIFTIRAAMDTKASWIRNREDAITLRHEQGHFDIAEIYARMLRKNIRKAKTKKESEIIYEKVMEAENREHDAYDRENTFLLGGTTNAWALKIAKRLQQLAAYDEAKIVVSALR